MSHPELSSEPIDVLVPAEQTGCRLDWFLAQQFPAFSRVNLRRAINAAGVQVNGQRTKASYRLRGGERLTVFLPDLPRETPQPENIPLQVLYEDESLAVI